MRLPSHFKIDWQRESADVIRTKITQMVLDTITVVYPPFIATFYFFGMGNLTTILSLFYLGVLLTRFITKKHVVAGKILAFIVCNATVTFFALILPPQASIQLWYIVILFQPFLFFDAEVGVRRFSMVFTILATVVLLQFNLFPSLATRYQFDPLFIQAFRISTIFLSGISVLLFTLMLDSINELHRLELIKILTKTQESQEQLRSQKHLLIEQARRSAMIRITGNLANDLKPRLIALNLSGIALKKELQSKGKATPQLEAKYRAIIQHAHSIHHRVQNFKQLATQVSVEQPKLFLIQDLIKELLYLVPNLNIPTQSIYAKIRAKKAQVLIGLSYLLSELTDSSFSLEIKEDNTGITFQFEKSKNTLTKSQTSETLELTREILEETGAELKQSKSSIEIHFAHVQPAQKNIKLSA